MNKPISKALKIFYGFGDFGFSLMTAVEMMAFTTFLTEIAQFSLATATGILLITSTIDAILSPFYGAIVSGVKAMKWGRYRSWMLLAPPLVVVFYALQFSKFGNETMAAVIICVGFVVSHILWNIAWVANVSLITVLGKTEAERGMLASRRMTWTNANNLVSSYTSLSLGLTLGALLKNPVLGFTLLAAMNACMMLIGYYTVFSLTKGYEDVAAEKLEAAEAEKQAAKADKASAKDMIKGLFMNPPLLVLLVADLAKNLVIFMYFASLFFHYLYVLQRPDMFTVHMLAAAIASVIGSYTGGFLIKKLTAKTAVLSAVVVAIAAFIGGKIFAFNLVPFIVCMSLFMFVIGIIYAGFVSFYTDTAIYGEWKTGKNTTGFIMGLQNVPIKVAVIIRSALFSALLAAGGYVAYTQAVAAGEAVAIPETLQTAIANAITIVPAICLAIVFVLVIVFPLNKAKVEGLQAEIDQRKAS